MLLHPEHFSHIGELVFRTVSVYSHVIFAVYITLTLLDGYKGQTLGRYLMKTRVVSVSDRKLNLIEAAVRNIGKVFLLPLDLLIGLVFFRDKGYIKFFDYYTRTKTELVDIEEELESREYL